MSRKFKKYFLIFFIIVSVFLFFFSLSPAEALEVNYPQIFGQTIGNGTTLPQYVKYIFNFALIAIGLILLGVLVWGGVIYLTSTGNPVKLKEARGKIGAAFLGALLLFSSYIVLYTINPQLLVFKIPSLSSLEHKIWPNSPTYKPEEVSLITMELPLGQIIEKGVWSKEELKKLKDIIDADENFLREPTTVGKYTTETISSLVKQAENLARECRCSETKALCSKPKDFSMPIGCAGDPCPKKTRQELDKILKIIKEKEDNLNKHRKEIIGINKDLAEKMTKYNYIEEKIFSCAKDGNLSTLSEHLSDIDYYANMGGKVVTLTPSGFPPSMDDPLNFYCSVGGTAFDYNQTSGESSSETKTPFEEPLNSEAIGQKISCPAEIPLGQLLDKLKDASIIFSSRLNKIIKYHNQMAEKLEKISEAISECSDEKCKVNCCCVPNPCYQKCGTLICDPFCKSPCLQAVGNCYGKPCPYDKINKILKEIKKIDNENFSEISETREYFYRIEPLLTYQKDKPINLKSIREAINFCSGAKTNEEVGLWELRNCDQAMGNIGPDGKIIGACHPQNLYCCVSSSKKIPSPIPISQLEEPTIMPAKTYQPLKTDEKGCPQGYLCDSARGTMRKQYQDASKPLKQLLSCMRERLDAYQKEEKIKNKIGRINSITDPNLYTNPPQCDWIKGSQSSCVHKYGSLISPHYGGLYCRFERQSYAVDFSDVENSKYIIKAVRECRPDAYICYSSFNEKCQSDTNHIEISLGNTTGSNCGTW